jgi:hydroxysqualene synthase
VVSSADLQRAYDGCLRLAREHYENFPVASRLVPAAMRHHVAAVYAFARLADDMADEGDLAADVRLARLADWRKRLWACEAGHAGPAGAEHAEVFVALAATMRACHLPAQLFDDLISAFAQDVTTKRYDTWRDVLEYCRRSANPVGRLVLRIAGCENDRADLASDEVCTALQLANFWQDFAIDWERGRLYVPADTWRAHGATIESLQPASLTPEWRSTLGECCRRTREMFDRGRPVCDAVQGRLRWELRLTWLGGTRILRRVERAGFDMVSNRPALGGADVPALVWGLLRWPGTRL